MKKLSPMFVLPSIVAFAMTCVFVGCGSQEGGVAATAAADEALWCKEHGVEEKYCVLCHPEIREDPDMLLCAEHGDIPEAICTACHPELKEKYETCPHELPTAFCPTCHPESGIEHAEGGAHDEHDHAHEGEGERQE